MDLSRSRVALVTGGSRGIGRSIVEELTRRGWRVAFTYTSNEHAASVTQSALRAEGFDVSYHKADVRDFERAAEVIAEVEKSLGPIDLLVNNAGIKRDCALFRMSPEQWRDVIDTNVTGTFNYSRNVVYGMIRRGSGTIINIVSVSGIIGLPGQTNYSTSKAAIIGFTKALAKEVARFKIRVNAVAPGLIETDMLKDMPESNRKSLVSQIPLGSAGTPGQVASVVAFLAEDSSAYVTGQVLPVDGGMV